MGATAEQRTCCSFAIRDLLEADVHVSSAEACGVDSGCAPAVPALVPPTSEPTSCVGLAEGAACMYKTSTWTDGLTHVSCAHPIAYAGESSPMQH